MKKLWLLVALMLCFALPCAAAEEAPASYTCGVYKYVLLEDGTAEITGYVGDTKLLAKLELPSELDGHPVTSLEKFAFMNCSKLRIVTLPDSLVNMESNPFSYCWELREIRVSPDHPVFATIDGVLFHKPDKKLICYPLSFTDTAYAVPKGILAIGDSAFSRCKSLTSITLPDTVTTIESSAFVNCTNLASITLPGSVTTIGSSAFNTCFNMTSITLSEGLTTIGDRAFHNCAHLTSISLPDSLVTMGSNPFDRCTRLTDISFSPDHPVFEMIDGVLFHKADMKLICYPCSSAAAEYTIPDGTLTIGDYAFTFCISLQRITLPDSVTTIGKDAFSECNLTDITIPHSVTSIGNGAFSYCNELISITLPDSITSIEDDTFNSCENLASLTIPEGVASIGERAFSLCKSLTNVTIPDSVTSIGKNAFNSCNKLKTVTVPHDSYAEQYCKDNNLPVAYPDAADWLNN